MPYVSSIKSATQTKNGFCSNPLSEKCFSLPFKAWKLRCTWIWRLYRRFVIGLLACILLRNLSQTGRKGRNKTWYHGLSTVNRTQLFKNFKLSLFVSVMWFWLCCIFNSIIELMYILKWELQKRVKKNRIHVDFLPILIYIFCVQLSCLCLVICRFLWLPGKFLGLIQPFTLFFWFWQLKNFWYCYYRSRCNIANYKNT